MDRESSSFSPESMFLHAYIDKLWNNWQNKVGDSTPQHRGDLDSLIVSTTVTVRQVLDISNLPGGVSVTYKPSICRAKPKAGHCNSCQNNGKTVSSTKPFAPIQATP